MANGNGHDTALCDLFASWRTKKEFAALREYLRQNPNNYFESEIEIRIQCDNRAIDEKQFEILSKYLELKNKI